MDQADLVEETAEETPPAPKKKRVAKVDVNSVVRVRNISKRNVAGSGYVVKAGEEGELILRDALRFARYVERL